MITYFLMVSKTFPAYHPKKAEATDFETKIAYKTKLHTLRKNYELWRKRFAKIDAGIACLSVRVWAAEPRKSKQIELFRFTKTSGIGLEKLADPTNAITAEIEGKNIYWQLVAQNDGLSFKDFCDWFKVRENKPMAVIHFTEFRYGVKG